MAKGRNPLKYSEIFDLSDKSVVNQLIKDIQKVDSEYNKLAQSIDKQSKAMRDSFVRTAEQMIAASQRLNVSRAQDRDALRELAAATDTLRQRQRDQQKNEEDGVRGKKYAADSVKGLKAEILALIKEYETLSKSEATQAARMKEISDRVKDLRGQQKSLSDELRLTKKTVDAVTGSYNALEQETKELTKQLKALPGAFDGTNKEAQRLVRQINENNTKLKDFDRTLNLHNRNVGNYRSALGGAGTMLKAFALSMAAAYLGFQSINQMGEKIVQTNAQISDSLADVRRTAELTAAEGDNLVDSLKQLDTRTTLKGLVDLATIGGQLGVPKAELVGFVSAIDQLTVSLKGEISGGAEEMAKGLGKINAVFKIATQEGVDTEQAMLKTGSAILKLGQAGLATGDYLVDFGQRVGGVAAAAGISLPKVLAYGATLEELGISAEVAGTTMSQLISVLAKSPEAFFKIAQLGDATLNLKEFTNTINTDTAAALDQFFKGLQTGGADLTTFSRMISSLGLDGTRATAVVSALAKNTQTLEIRTRQATDAFQKGSLASEQFQLKNTNLAAAFEKLGNTITNAFVNSEFAQSLATFINRMVDGKTEADDLTNSFKAQEAELQKMDDLLPPLLAEYDRLTAKAKELGGENKLTAEEQDTLNQTMDQISKILPGAIAEVDKYGNVIAIARDKVNGLTTAMRENLQAAGRTAAQALRSENEERQKKIRLLQEEIKVGTVTLPTTGAPGGFVPATQLPVDRAANQEEIAKLALRQAEAVKQLRDVLQQQLSPAEQEVYDKFYGNQKRSTTAAEEQAKKQADLAEAQRKAEEAAKAAGTSLDEFGRKGKRARTEFELLEEQVKKLENTIRSQAMHGKVNKDALDQLVVASNRLKAAQEAGDTAIQQALFPYSALTAEVGRLNEQLQNEITAGKDTTQTVKDLTAASTTLENVQGQIKLAVAGTVGEQERLNTQLELTRKELERQAAAGNVNNNTLNQYANLTVRIRENNEALQLSILQVTDPMGALALQADQLKRTLTEQALAGNLSSTELEKYRAILIKIAEANAKLQQASAFNPLDPTGRIASADMALEVNQRGINAVSPRAEGGDRDFLRHQQRLEQQRLQLIMQRLDAEQAQYQRGSREWEQIETEKTRVLADQERLRSKISEQEIQYRTELLTQGLGLMQQALTGWYQLQKDQGDQQLAKLEEDKERELELAGNNANQRAMIEEKYAQQQRAIKRRQAQQEKQNALFQIAIETAIGSAKAIASSPLTFGMPWLAFVLAQGALSAALVAARPIPQFWKGTKNAPAGVVMVGEKGQEAIESRDGSVRLSGHTAHYDVMQGGEIIHTADSPETRMYQRMFEDRDSHIGMGRMYVTAAGKIINAREEYEARLTASAIDRLASKTDQLTAATRNGHAMVADAVRKNKPVVSKSPNWFNLNNRADYITNNMLK